MVSCNEVGDKYVKWIYYTANEAVCSRFLHSVWYLIAQDINSDKEFAQVLANNEYVKCYILVDKCYNNPIAFVYVKRESLQDGIVSIHGGGWNKSMRLSILYYRGITLLIEYLQNRGIKVRTSCLIGNTRALRFLYSIGFVKYRTTDTHIYMWINEKRLKQTSIYKRYCKQS